MVKRRGSNLVRNLAISAAIGGSDTSKTIRNMRIADSAGAVNASNMEFMEAVGYWLSEAAEVGARTH